MAGKDTDAKAKFSVDLENNVSASANEAADSLEGLRKRIASGDDALKGFIAQQRRLVGSSDAVKSAKAELTAKINAEKAALSAASLKLAGLGTSYDKLSTQTKKLGAQQEELARNKLGAMNAALSKAGGPLASLREKLKEFADVAGGEGAGASGIMTLAAGGLATAVVAVTVALVAGAVSLAKWIFRSADSARSMDLVREAATGGAQNAYALGTQIDALAEKVPTGKKALNDLAVSMAKGGIQGQTLVDTLNAVAQTSAAMGDEAGAKIKALIDRGRLSQRVSIGGDQTSDDLLGTGVQRDDVAAALAKNMHVGIDEARQALAEGRVKLGDGAKAINDAVEAKMGNINLRKMMSLDVIGKKFQETLSNLTKGVKLDPLLLGITQLAKMFDTSTVSGAALRDLVSAFGNAAVSAFSKSLPYVQKFMDGLIIGALDVGIAVLQLRNWLTKTFGDSELLKNVDGLKLALDAGKFAVGAIAAAVIALGAAVALAVGPFVALYLAMSESEQWGEKLGTSLRKWFLDIDWAASGMAIVDGLIGGIKAGATKLVDAVKGLASSVKDAFTGSLKIQSPSKVFAEFGVNTTEGYSQGIEEGTPAAARSLDGMTAMPSSGAAAAGRVAAGGGGGPISVNVTINVGGGGDVAKQLQDPSILAPLIKAIEDALLGGGVPVPT